MKKSNCLRYIFIIPSNATSSYFLLAKHKMDVVWMTGGAMRKKLQVYTASLLPVHIKVLKILT